MEVNHRRNGKRYQSRGKRRKMTSDWTDSDFMSPWVKRRTAKRRRRLENANLREEIAEDFANIYTDDVVEFVYHQLGIYRVFAELGMSLFCA